MRCAPVLVTLCLQLDWLLLASLAGLLTTASIRPVRTVHQQKCSTSSADESPAMQRKPDGTFAGFEPTPPFEYHDGWCSVHYATNN